MNKSIANEVNAVNETVSTLSDLSSKMEFNLETIEESKNHVNISNEILTRSQVVMNQVTQAIHDLDSGNSDLVNEIEKITDGFSEITNMMANISSKTQIINDITFQTKLLSFNASVEAARAGEQGKGFTVVAEEIANLAQTSSVAAVEINSQLSGGSDLINAVLSQIELILQAHFKASKNQVHHGAQKVHEATEMLSQVVDNMTTLQGMFDQIASASYDQKDGVSIIHEAISLFQNQIKSAQAMISANRNISNEMNQKADEILVSITETSEPTLVKRMIFVKQPNLPDSRT